jgi:hypothetical protein
MRPYPRRRRISAINSRRYQWAKLATDWAAKLRLVQIGFF